jgi:hypothetical protein
MPRLERLRVTRRKILVAGGATLGGLTERWTIAGEKPSGGQPSTQMVEVFRGAAKEVSLESSDREGGYSAKHLVRDDAPIAGKKTLTWHWDSPLRNGEAQLERATLMVRDDGFVLFTAILQSRSADDHWNVFFSIRSKANPSQSLVTLPKQPEPARVSPDGVTLYQWLQFPAPQKPLQIAYEFSRFDPKVFADLGDVILACDC